MVIFHSYVSLPEGICAYFKEEKKHTPFSPERLWCLLLKSAIHRTRTPGHQENTLKSRWFLLTFTVHAWSVHDQLQQNLKSLSLLVVFRKLAASKCIVDPHESVQAFRKQKWSIFFSKILISRSPWWNKTRHTLSIPHWTYHTEHLIRSLFAIWVARFPSQKNG